jgi:hypothetical protein
MPWAATGAIGNGSFSTSLVIRYSTYPSAKLSIRPSNCPMIISPIGTYHAGWKKLRWPRMSGLVGVTHDGILSASPSWRNDSLWTMNWFQSNPEPLTRLAPAM